MKKWWMLYLAQGWDKRMLWTAGVLAALPVLFATVMNRSPGAAAPTAEAAFALDTHIPKGFVLVPIEADNYESLDSILGRYGWVDLFQSGTEGGRRKLVARNVRLLRAPQNPQAFAVLIRERDSARILEAGGVFTVVVRRPGREQTEIMDEPVARARALHRRITYGE